MIHAQEIRIGNCVKDSHGKIRFITHRILSDIASNPGNHGYEPLELNEERLAKFGFKFKEDLIINEYETEKIYVFRKNDYKYYVGYVTSSYGGEKETHWRFRIDFEIVYVKYEINYVHQLQNLYYAITGEELEVHNIK